MKDLLFPFSFAIGAVLAYLEISKYKIPNITDTLPINGAGWGSRDLEQVTDITIHHSAGGRFETIKGIAKYHTDPEPQGKGWRGVGYHIVLYGFKAFQTNELEAYTWHNGTNNRYAIGICVMGNHDTQPVDNRKIRELVKVIKKLKADPRLPNLSRLVAHGEYRGHTNCPGGLFPIDELREAVNMPGAEFSASAPNALFSSSKLDDGYRSDQAD